MAITDVIKYEGDNSTFIWKHPCEDFNSLTQLIVHESQEAVFFMNGQALDTFGPGRYQLNSENIPILGKIYKDIVTGGVSPFHCEVYFINQTVQMALRWGTDSKVRYIDPDTGVPLELGASGEMNLQVCDSRKLLLKMVGTMKGIAWGEDGGNFTKSVQQSFRPVISTAVKSNLTQAIKLGGYDILEVDEHLSELSAALKEKITPGFEEFGLTIPQFYVTTIVLPEDDRNFQRIRELHTISFQKRILEAEAEVKAKQIQTDTDVRAFQAQKEAGVTAAKRELELEKQLTETEIAKREAERKIIGAQAEAEVTKLGGFAEAEVMRAKGYNEKDIIQAEVQKAFAEGMGNMGSGGNAGGGLMSDIVGLGVGMQAAGAMSGQLQGIFNGMNGNNGSNSNNGQQQPADPSALSDAVPCPNCGKPVPANAKFCLECGTKIEHLSPNELICPACGAKTPKGKFCIECGAPLINKCPNCGAELPAGSKFCLECGTKIQ